MADKEHPTDPGDVTEDDLGEPLRDVDIDLDEDKPTTMSFRTTLGQAKSCADYAAQQGLSTSEFIRDAIAAAMTHQSVTVTGLSPATTSHVTSTLRSLLEEVSGELREAS